MGSDSEPRLYSYVVKRDFGFAPNPFYGACTLATCKPQIRKGARVGDWVVGTGSAGYGLSGHIVFAMRIDEALTFDDYWCDERFLGKRPNLRASLQHAFGDNIYRRNRRSGEWIQVNSHHSCADGKPNPLNVDHDTRVDRVLVSFHYRYWGGEGPKIPQRFREGANAVCKGRPGHLVNFPPRLVERFLAWLELLEGEGYLGEPAEFAREYKRRVKRGTR